MRTKYLLATLLAALLLLVAAAGAFSQSNTPRTLHAIHEIPLIVEVAIPVNGEMVTSTVGISLTIDSEYDLSTDEPSQQSITAIADVSAEPGDASVEVGDIDLTQLELSVDELPSIDPLSLLPTLTPQPATAPSVDATGTPAVDGPVANTNANLREGPGTNYAITDGTTAGQALTITGRNDAGDWLQLDDGAWIAAFLVDNAPADISVASDIPTPQPVNTPKMRGTAEPLQTEDSGGGLVVEYRNMHYECQMRDLEFETEPGITSHLWGHRSFQADMFITNNSDENVEPPWEPSRWIITDGTNEFVSDLALQWVNVRTGLYKQPVIAPGASDGWTFLAFPIAREQWVKAAEFDWNGETYRTEFDLGPYGDAYNYTICAGEDRAGDPTFTPAPPTETP